MPEFAPFRLGAFAARLGWYEVGAEDYDKSIDPLADTSFLVIGRNNVPKADFWADIMRVSDVVGQWSFGVTQLGADDPIRDGQSLHTATLNGGILAVPYDLTVRAAVIPGDRDGAYLQLLCGWVESTLGGPIEWDAGFSSKEGPYGTQLVALHAWSPRIISLNIGNFFRDVHHRGDLSADWIGVHAPTGSLSEGSQRLNRAVAYVHNDKRPVGFVVANGALVDHHDLDSLEGTARTRQVLAELLEATAPNR